MKSSQVLNMDEVNSPHNMFSIYNLNLRVQAWNMCGFKNQTEALKIAQKMAEKAPQYKSRKNSGICHSHAENYSFKIPGQGFAGKKISLVGSVVQRDGRPVHQKWLQANGQMLEELTHLSEMVAFRTNLPSGDVFRGRTQSGKYSEFASISEGRQMSLYGPLFLFTQSVDGTMKVTVNTSLGVADSVARNNRIQAAYRTGMKVTIGTDGEPIVTDVPHTPRKRSNRRGGKGQSGNKPTARRSRQSGRWKRSNQHLPTANSAKHLSRSVGSGKVVEWSQSQANGADNTQARQHKC